MPLGSLPGPAAANGECEGTGTCLVALSGNSMYIDISNIDAFSRIVRQLASDRFLSHEVEHVSRMTAAAIFFRIGAQL